MLEHATYLKEIVGAYRAEVRGSDESEIWKTLTRLESTTRERLIPLLQRHRLDTTPDSEQWRLGQERGRARAATGFAATIQSMTEALPPYLTLYARLAAEGSAEDRSELAGGIRWRPYGPSSTGEQESARPSSSGGARPFAGPA